MVAESSDPAVDLLLARRAELTGGVDSIGVQEAQIAAMQSQLDVAVSALAADKAELARIDEVVALLSPPDPTPEPEPDPEVSA